MKHEFYKLRRTKIIDFCALIGFVVGLFVNAYDAGTYLADGFDQGLIGKGLAYFVGIVFGSGLIGGAFGAGIGYVLSVAYQYGHIAFRKTRGDSIGTTTADAAASDPRLQPVRGVDGRASVSSAARTAPKGIRFERFDEQAAEAWLTLSRKLLPQIFDRSRAAVALTRTVNIGAWDGDRLVGAVRILSDGYFFATIPDLVVDSHYERRGIGRELMYRALEASPNSVMYFATPPHATAFFERIGCERAPTGYMLRRRSAAATGAG